MQTLETLFKTLARRTNARFWVGKRPDVRKGQLLRAIAMHVGYPTSSIDPLSNEGMVSLDWRQAAHVLAVSGATSLVHGNCSPPSGRVKDAARALKDLAGDAVFVSNGLWESGGPSQWSPLTSATFDCGLMGYDAENAFIFWAEEED